jgi:SdpI/YfhL protein family
MDVIPVPEIVLALVIGLVVFGVRAVWRVSPASLAPRTSDFGQPRPEGEETDQVRARLIASCVIFVVISIPLILKVVPPNGIYGFRTSLTQSSRSIWYPANAFMGWALLIAAIVSAGLQFALPSPVRRSWLWFAFLTPICGAIVASFIYLSRLH